MKGELKDPRKTFGKAVSDIAENDERIYVLSADSGGSSGFKEFAAAHPDRYFEFGIMEQGVTGIASGMATTGKIPVFCAIAPFVTCRNYEMFRNDLGYMRQNVKIVGRNGGFTYSDLGATHHSLEDYAIMRMIPGVVVLAPQSPDEIRGAAKAMLAHDGPVYMRIGNPPIPELYDGEREFVIGKGQLRQLEYLLRLQPKAYHIIQEEVMQGIGAYQVFGLLGDVAFFIRGKQLGADGRIQNALQHLPRGGKGGIFNACLNNPADQGFRHAAVDAIHAHMIAVICGPT